MPKAGLLLVDDSDSFLKYLPPSSENSFTSKGSTMFGFRPCRDLIVTPLQGPLVFVSKKHTGGQKTKSLFESTWRELLTCWAHIWLLNAGRNVPCLFLKCLGNFVCASIWHHTPLPIFQIFFFFFFRPGIVIKRRGEIRVWRFNYLHMLRTQDIHIPLSHILSHALTRGASFYCCLKSLLVMLILRMLPPPDRKCIILGRFPDVGIQIGS